MFNKTRNVTAILLTVLLSVVSIPLSNYTGVPEPPKAYAASNVSLKVGDYIQFGKYYGDDILWRVINKNSDDSYLLYSEKILCLKCFDAYGDLTDGRGDKYRIQYGSNCWEKSSLREWLNSSDQTVNYSCQTPDKEHVNGGYNEYSTEAGFLTNFTVEERSIIKPVDHKSLLAEADSSIKDGGSEYLLWESDMGNIVQNYNTAFYKNVIDSVYILDVKEIHDFLYARGYDYTRNPTAKAVENSNFKSSYFKKENKWYYWTRTPDSYKSYSLHTISSGGHDYNYYGSSGDYANEGDGGVVPALNLKAGVYAYEGEGNITSPYRVKWAEPLKDKTPPKAPKVNTVKSASKSIIGVAEAYAKVQAFVKNNKIGETKADKKGQFKISIKSQKAGTTVIVYCIDLAGNKSAGTKLTVKK